MEMFVLLKRQNRFTLRWQWSLRSSEDFLPGGSLVLGLGCDDELPTCFPECPQEARAALEHCTLRQGFASDYHGWHDYCPPESYATLRHWGYTPLEAWRCCTDRGEALAYAREVAQYDRPARDARVDRLVQDGLLEPEYRHWCARVEEFRR